MRISDWSSDVCSSDLIAQPYLDGFQPLIASFGLGVMKLGLGQPREKAGLALATSLDVGLDLRALQPLQCVRQASVGSRRSIDARDAEWIMSREVEGFRPSDTGFTFRHHHACDQEQHLFFILRQSD